MSNVIYLGAANNAPAPDEETRGSQNSGAPRTVKPRLNVSVLPPVDSSSAPARQLKLEGRDAWALDQLIRAGDKGCSPISNPAPRWSCYVQRLRRLGIVIETVTEKHGGAFAGTHGTYKLRSRCCITHTVGLGGNPQRVSA